MSKHLININSLLTCHTCLLPLLLLLLLGSRSAWGLYDSTMGVIKTHVADITLVADLSITSLPLLLLLLLLLVLCRSVRCRP
jgi:hypothetical protein